MRSTLILDSLECFHRHVEDPPKIAPLVVEYKLKHTYMVEELHIDVLELSITKLIW